MQTFAKKCESLLKKVKQCDIIFIIMQNNGIKERYVFYAIIFDGIMSCKRGENILWLCPIIECGNYLLIRK